MVPHRVRPVMCGVLWVLSRHMVPPPLPAGCLPSPSRGTRRRHHDRSQLTALFGIFCASCRRTGLFKGAAGLSWGLLPEAAQIGGFIMKLAWGPGGRRRGGGPELPPREGETGPIELFRRYLGVLPGLTCLRWLSLSQVSADDRTTPL